MDACSEIAREGDGAIEPERQTRVLSSASEAALSARRARAESDLTPVFRMIDALPVKQLVG
jgi:hypothetical protein